MEKDCPTVEQKRRQIFVVGAMLYFAIFNADVRETSSLFHNTALAVVDAAGQIVPQFSAAIAAATCSAF